MPHRNQATQDAADMRDDEPELTNNLSAAADDESTMESLTDNTQEQDKIGVVNLAFEENEDRKRKSSFDAQKEVEQEKNAANGKILNHNQQQIHIPEDAVINYETARLRKTSRDQAKVKEVVALDMFSPPSDCAKAQEAMLCDHSLVANGGTPTVPVSSPLTSSELGNGHKMFEEYFIPVNTHKKFLRGEKLYLTKDKRKGCTGWKKIMLCCLLLITLGIAVLVGVLTATGFLLRESMSPPKSVHVDPSSPAVSASTSKLKGAPPPREEMMRHNLGPLIIPSDIANTTTTEVPAATESTTNAPSTSAPLTTVPPTRVPSSSVPTTDVPTTRLPTTVVPTTDMPTTSEASWSQSEATTMTIPVTSSDETEEETTAPTDQSEPEFRTGPILDPLDSLAPNDVIGEIALPDEVFTEQFGNMSSPEAQNLSAQLRNALKKILLDQGLQFDDVKIVGYRKGSIVASFVVASGDKEIPPQQVTEIIRKFLDQNEGKLGGRVMDVSSLKTESVVNGCKYENGFCPFMCHWDYVKKEKTCICPDGYINMDGTCIHDEPKSAVAVTTPLPDTTTMDETTTPSPTVPPTTNTPTESIESTEGTTTSANEEQTDPTTFTPAPHTEKVEIAATTTPGTTAYPAESTTETQTDTTTTDRLQTAVSSTTSDPATSQEETTTATVTENENSEITTDAPSTIAPDQDVGSVTERVDLTTTIPTMTSTTVVPSATSESRGRRVEDTVTTEQPTTGSSGDPDVIVFGMDNETTTTEMPDNVTGVKMLPLTALETTTVTEPSAVNEGRSFTEMPAASENETVSGLNEEMTTTGTIEQTGATTMISEGSGSTEAPTVPPENVLPETTTVIEVQHGTETAANTTGYSDGNSEPGGTDSMPLDDNSGSFNATDSDFEDYAAPVGDNATDSFGVVTEVVSMPNTTDMVGTENSTASAEDLTTPVVLEGMVVDSNGTTTAATTMVADFNGTEATTAFTDSSVERVDKELSGTNRTYAMGRNLTFMNNMTMFDDGVDVLNGSVAGWNMTVNDTSYDVGNYTFVEAREANGAGAMNESSGAMDDMTEFYNVTTTQATTVMEAMCDIEQFMCPVGGKCIDRGLLCDEFHDCPDGFDEQNCTTCENNFRCNDGKCITASAKCDGVWDCQTGEDEQLCGIVNTTCVDFEVMCLDNSACIKPLSICDGVYNCRDRSDENGCVERTTCESSNRFYCGDGLCIPSSLRCDGHHDCKDGEDEVNCSCSDNQFQCMNDYCVSRTSDKNPRCDGVADCNDTSDEIGCVQVDTNGIVNVYETSSGNMALMCADNFSIADGDRICQEMGYSKAVALSSVMVETNLTIWTKWDALSAETYWSQGIKTTDTCSDGALRLQCQQFECANQTEVLFRIEREASVQGHHSDVWPYLALIYGVNSDRACHAEILSPMWLLTSAGCLDQLPSNVSWLNVQANFDGDGLFVEQKDVAQVVKHPHASQFRSNVLPDYDLALVRLAQPLEFSSHLTSVCLPEDVVRPGVTCFVGSFGDGRARVPFEKSPSIIHLPLVINEPSTCNSDLHYKKSVSNQMICADGGNMKRQLCDSDLGSPLMCLSSNNIWRLAGVLSYQRFCGAYHKQPAVFANIFGMRDFIDTFTGLKFYNVTQQPFMYSIPVVPMMRDDVSTEIPLYKDALEPNTTDLYEPLLDRLQAPNTTDIFDYEAPEPNATDSSVGLNATEILTAAPAAEETPRTHTLGDVIVGLGQFPYPLLPAPHRGIGSPRHLDVDPQPKNASEEVSGGPRNSSADVDYLADQGVSSLREQNDNEDVTTSIAITSTEMFGNETATTETPEEKNGDAPVLNSTEGALGMQNSSLELFTEAPTTVSPSEERTTVTEEVVEVATTAGPLASSALASKEDHLEGRAVDMPESETTTVANDDVTTLPLAAFNDVRLADGRVMARIDGVWFPVCGENWDGNLSDVLCRELGYGKATETELIAVTTPFETSLVYTKQENETERSLVSSLMVSNDTCSTALSVTCEEYECGSWNLAHGDEPGPHARIVSTTGATQGQWPSVGLLKAEDKVCIASILSPNWLVTSWSCVSNSSAADDASAWHFVQDAPLLTRADAVVSRNYTLSHMLKHPQLQTFGDVVVNDVVLVKTAQPVDVMGAARAVCLSNNSVQPQQLCVTVGWGMSDSESTQHLHYLPVPVMSLNECNSSHDGKLHGAVTCASFVDKEKALCQKDSGAPLICMSEHNRWEIQGVLTFKEDCDSVLLPSVFTSVYQVSHWIKEVLSSSRR
ncbi:uncharacterized protein LOC135393828 isoform X2 [Ornithodoros turicata]|uniref:uncharacterized protein LOC135393828 isoform X2 n=1 Tax=Ornithodoros turicata TaxID=34597 RepID=UPI0031394DBA